MSNVVNTITNEIVEQYQSRGYITYEELLKKVEDVEGYYKQILAARRVHDFVKDENYEKLDNPYIGSFENNFNFNEMEDLYLK